MPDGMPPLITIPGQRPLLDLFPVDGHKRTSAWPATGDTPQSLTEYGEQIDTDSTDPHVLYHSTAHDHAAQQVLGAIGRREALVVVAGEAGIGKTLMCRTIVEELDRRTLTSIVGPMASIGEFLRTVLVDFGVISRDDLTRGRLVHATAQELSDTLRDFLLSLSALQAFAVVMIDEAHRLSAKTLAGLEILLNLSDGDPLMQIVLVGRPPLLETLRRPELDRFARRVSVWTQLGPLTADEMSGYVFHRLAVSKGTETLGFRDAALEAIHEVAVGIPRDVNALCEAAILHAQLSPSGFVEEAHVQAVFDDLELSRPSARPRRVRYMVLMAVMLVVLAVAGAVGAAVLYRSDVAMILSTWRGSPPPSETAGLPAPLSP